MKCFTILLVLFSVKVQGVTEASIAECIKASARLARQGNGSTPVSCMSCDPTHGKCSPRCQNKVDYLYYACDGICLPDGYYFDPPLTLYGCWKSVLPKVKIAVERCGCNSSFTLSHSISLSFVMIIILSIYFL